MNGGRKKSIVRTIIRLLILLPLLLSAFLVYSLLKIRSTPSAPVAHQWQAGETPLYGHVEHLSVTIGSRSVYEYDQLNAAKEYIFSRLKSMGHTPVLQDYSYLDRIFSNIIVSIPGKADPGEIVLIGAHYDTVAGTPGADDNASAVALLLEMCRLLRHETPDRTLRLVFFTLEEPPVFRSDFMGSAVHAKEARSRQENIVAMISLEMLGYYSDEKGGQSFPFPLMSLIYPTTPDFVAVVGNLSSRGLVKKIATSLRKTGGIGIETLATSSFVPGIDFSDHRSFWKMDYPAAMITDTAFYRNPNYHTENDTIDTLDFTRMNMLLHALVQMAKDLSRKP
ncbi:MAG: aminopeptidase [Syntrophus sp. (in: bacteria)]|nr:aminopeptidase [Syntrophus sp. (in: bacteria)]